MIALHGAHVQRAHMRRHLAVAEGQIARPVIEQAMAALLRFQRQGKGGIAADVDLLDRVHLDRDGQCHVTTSFKNHRPPHIRGDARASAPGAMAMISKRLPRRARPGRLARYKEAARAMRVCCAGPTDSAAARARSRALTSTKQTGPKGGGGHQVDLARHGFSAAAPGCDSPSAAATAPPGFRWRWPRRCGGLAISHSSFNSSARA